MSKNTQRIIPNKIINMYYYKPCCNNNKTRGMSFLAFVLCVFFCGCIFYVFIVSPCDVMSDVRFLFFFSNTLVLIIAADYGAFASSSSEENLEKSYGPVQCSVVVKIADGSFAETENKARELLVVGADSPKEEEGPVPCSGLVKLPIATYSKTDNDVKELVVMGADSTMEEEKVVEDDIDVDEEVKLLSYNGAGSFEVCDNIEIDEDGEGSMVADEEDRVAAEEEEIDEFSWMSDEELNKRVEEFIRRLKTQIRQQAVGDTE